MNHKEPPQRRARPRRRAVWLYVILLGMTAASVGCLLIDHAIIGWLGAHPSPWNDNVWVDGFKQLGKAGTPIWLLLVWSCLTDRWRPTLVTIAALILVGASVCPLKAMVRRCRPNAIAAASQSAPPQEISWQEKVSFPSGDTAVAFAVAITLSFFLSRLWMPALFVAAGAVGLLRVTALAHYPSDVVAGALLGTLCGLAALRYTASRPSLDQFRIPRRWRLSATPVLLLIVPVISPFIGMISLQIFLKIYAIPLAALALLYLAAARRTRKPFAARADAVEGDAGPPAPRLAIGKGSPVQNHALEDPSPSDRRNSAGGDPNQKSKSDFLKEPAS